MMAMDAVQIAPVGDVPYNGYWCTGRLRKPCSEARDSLHDTEHAFANS